MIVHGLLSFIPQFQPIADKKGWKDITTGKQILLHPDDKMEAENTIVDKHGTVTPVIINDEDKVMISPDESSDVQKKHKRVTMSPEVEGASEENDKVIINFKV